MEDIQSQEMIDREQSAMEELRNKLRGVFKAQNKGKKQYESVSQPATELSMVAFSVVEMSKEDSNMVVNGFGRVKDTARGLSSCQT